MMSHVSKYVPRSSYGFFERLNGSDIANGPHKSPDLIGGTHWGCLHPKWASFLSSKPTLTSNTPLPPASAPTLEDTNEMMSSNNDGRRYSCVSASQTLEWMNAIADFLTPFKPLLNAHVVNFFKVLVLSLSLQNPDHANTHLLTFLALFTE